MNRSIGEDGQRGRAPPKLHRMRARFFASFIILAAGCGGGGSVDGGSGDAGGRADAGPRADAGRTDAGFPVDAGEDAASDAGDAIDAGADAAAPVDAGMLMCAPDTAIPDGSGGRCDKRGRIQCERWAMDHGKANAIAVCTGETARCARANTCASADSCTCGDGPECEDDAMCVLVAISTYACVCLSDIP
jgi:hypothetical protein